MFIRLILLAIIFYLIYQFVKFFQAIGEAAAKPANPGSKTEKRKIMVKDEVCNTYIPEDEALIEKYKGKTFYFCSEECRDKFRHSLKTKNNS
ncbi:MAG: YHS domain-containing protein [Candidatus Aminicenantes bacterium]|nr:YHS domain-containing protein [Candidatus Aminicenantes bacterium]